MRTVFVGPIGIGRIFIFVRQKFKRAILFALPLLIPFCSFAQGQSAKSLNFKEDFGFQENRGQIQNQSPDQIQPIRYSLSDGNTTLYFHDNGVTYNWSRPLLPSENISEATGLPEVADDVDETAPRLYETSQVSMNWLNTRKGAEIIADDAFPSYSNYYLAHCPNGILNVRRFRKITYKNIYPDVDVVYYIKDGHVKYDVILHEGAHLSDVKYQYDGYETLSLDSGKIKLSTRLGFLHEQEPVAWNESSNIPLKYSFNKRTGVVSFSSEKINSGTVTEETTIDPVLIWGTYFGGGGIDYGYGTTADAAGNAYMVGQASSPTNMTFGSSHQSTLGGGSDAFLVKFNSFGVVEWSTYYGGTGGDVGRDVVVDGSGNIFITGLTASPNAIAFGAGFQSLHGGGNDAFIARFTSGGALVWGSYLGGTGNDIGRDLAFDGSNNLYLAGYGASTSGIATAGSHQQIYGGGLTDSFLARISPSGTLDWCTYLGGSDEEQSWALELDQNNIIFLSGDTKSTGMASAGTYQVAQGGLAGTADAFIARFSATGVFQNCTYYGGDGNESCRGMKLDGLGNVFISGFTTSTTGIATAGSHQPNHSVEDNIAYEDAFLAKFSNLNTLEWATFYGGSGDDEGRGLAVDGGNNIYLVGNTSSTSGISTPGTYQDTHAGPVNGLDAFIAKLDTNGNLVWGTYYGGEQEDYFISPTINGNGQAILAGQTFSTTGIASVGSHQETFGGVWDAYLVAMEVVDATIFYSRQDGSWGDFNSWSFGGHYGTSVSTGIATGSDEIIGNGNTITLDSDVNLASNTFGLQIDPGATLNGNGFAINLMGSMNVDGILVNGILSGTYYLSSSLSFVTFDQLNCGFLGMPDGSCTLNTDVVVLDASNSIDGGVIDAAGHDVCLAFINPPTSPIFSSPQATSVMLSWTAGAADAFIVARKGSTNLTPEFGVNYNANAAYGSGDMIGTDNYVVYKGSGTSVTITGLEAATNYEFDLYSFNTLVGGCYSVSNYQFASFTTCAVIAAPLNPVAANFCTGDAIPSVRVDTPAAGFLINWYSDALGTVAATGTTSGTRNEIFTPAAAGTFYTRVYESATGCSSSALTPVTLTEYPALVAGTPTIDEAICVGGDPAVIDGGTASGGNTTYTYQWESATMIGGPYAPISLATGATYDPPSGLAATTYYHRIVHSASCSVTGTPVTVSTVVQPIIVSSPQFTEACDAGVATSFDVSATGTTLTYQWQMDVGSGFNDITNGGVFSGATTTLLSVSDVSGLGDADFQCIVTEASVCPIISASATLTVHPLPFVVNAASSFCETAPGSGTATVDLTTFDNTIISGAGGMTVEWYTDAAFANPVATPATTSATNGVVFHAKAIDMATTCFAGATATITVNPSPTVTNVTPTFCETTPGSGTATVDLTTQNNTITGGVANRTVEWYTNAALTTPVATSTAAAATNGIVFHAKVINTISLCFSAATATITVNPSPTVANVTPTFCETTPGSGTATVDLTTLNNTITGGVANRTVEWYTNATFTTPVATPTATSATNGVVFHAKVINSISFCFSAATATITVNPSSTVTNAAQPFCETTPGSGTATIDLTTMNNSITGGVANRTVEWYTNAIFTTPVATPTATSATNGVVFHAKVINSISFCFSAATATITVNPSPTVTNAAQAFCETTPGSGTATVDLTTLNNTITGGAANRTVEWYTNATLTTPVATPTGTSATNGVVFHAKVINSISLCFSSATATITVNPSPTVTNAASEFCETTPGSGTATIDLTTLNNTVTGGGANRIVEWYTNATFTTPVATPASTSAANGVVFHAKVINSISSCFSGATATITVNPSPTVTNVTPVFCESAPGSGTATVDLTAHNNTITGGVANRTVEWYTNATFTTPVATPTGTSATNGVVFHAKVINSISLCFSGATATITVNPSPTVANAASAFCETTPGSGTATIDLTTLNNTITGGAANRTVEWYTNATFTTPVTTPTATSATNGVVFHAKVINSISLCFSGATATITVNPSPTVTNAASTFCETTPGSGTATVDLTTLNNTVTGGAANRTVEWYTNATFTTLVATPTGTSATNGVVYHAKVINSISLCFSGATATITIDPSPTVTNAASAFCETTPGSGTATIDLTTLNNTVTGGAANRAVEWYTNATFTTPVATPTATSAVNGVVFHAKVINSISLCFSGATATITVNPSPTVTNAASAFCETTPGSGTATIDLTTLNNTITGGAANRTVEWYTNATFTTPVTTPTATSAANGVVFHAKVINSISLCFSGATATITVNPSPTVTNATQAFCETTPGSGTATVDLTTLNNTITGGVANRTVEWYTNATFTTPIATPTATSATNGVVFHAKVINSISLCFSGATATITINPSPTVTNAAQAFCETTPGSGTATIDLTTLNNSITGGVANRTVEWYTNATFTTPVATPTATSATNGVVFHAKVINSISLCFSGATATITVSSKPVVSGITIRSICSGSATGITFTSSRPATTYTWTITPNSNITGASNGSGSSINQILTNTTVTQQSITYNVIPSASGCDGASFIQTVQVDPVVTSFNVVGGGEYCPGSTGSKVGLDQSQAGVTYTLLLNGSATTMTATPGGGAFNFPDVTTAGTYSVRGATALNCASNMTGSVPVSAGALPSGGTLSSTSQQLCIGENDTYTVSGIANATTFAWVLPSGVNEVSRNANSITVTAVSGTGGTISVTPGNTCGNGAPVQSPIVVSATPDIAIVLPSDVFVDKTASFDYQSSADLAEFAWNFGDGQISTDERPQIIYTQEGTFTVTLEVTSDGNCKNSDSQSLEVKPDGGLSETDIKNVVTANGDTKNDFLYIVNIEKYPSNEVILLDRWGVEVFRRKGYRNEWDLRKGDQYIPAGNYICIVKNEGKVVSRTITVLKNN